MKIVVKRADKVRLTMKKRFLILLAIVFCALATVVFPSTVVFAANVGEVVWSGAMNYNDDNNAVFALGEKAPVSFFNTQEKWNCRVNSATYAGGFYAGQTVIIGNEIYITGAEKDAETGESVAVLEKIDIGTGLKKGSLANVGSGNTVTSIYYDYLAVNKEDGWLFVVGMDKIEVVNIATFTEVAEYTCSDLGLAKNAFGNYHPAQYKDGYLICNGYSLKINGEAKEGEPCLTAVNTVTFGTVTETVDGKTTVYKKNYSWSSGAFIGDLFYVTCTDTVGESPTYGHVLLLAVDFKTGEVKHSFDAGMASEYASDPTTDKSIGAYNATGQVAYDSQSGYLYWSNRYCKYLFGVQVEKDGSFAAEKETASLSRNTGTVCAPVICNGRLYIAGQGESCGQGGDICVVDVNPDSANFMKEIYATETGIFKIQSNPILQFDEASETAYVYVQSYVSPGYLFVLADTPATKKADLSLLAVPSKGEVVSLDADGGSVGACAYEQIAIDDEGRLYVYNEEGYLFCFEKTEKYTFDIPDNVDKRQKYNALIAALTAYNVMSDAEKALYAEEYHALLEEVEKYNAWVDKTNDEQTSVVAILGGLVTTFSTVAAAAFVTKRR